MLTKKQLEEQELAADATQLELYQAFAKEIDEQSLGFEEFHPYQELLTEDEQQLSILLDDSHNFDHSAATQEVFLTSLMETFTSYQEIRIMDQTGKPAEFDLVGELETIELAGELAHTPYFKFKQDDGKVLLSPNFMQRANSFEEALRLMKTSPNDFFSSVIPEELNFTVSTEGQTAEVLFTDRILLNEMENTNANQFIDAIALTASSFGLSVKLTNVEPIEWNGLNFNSPLPETLGANPIHITF